MGTKRSWLVVVLFVLSMFVYSCTKQVVILKPAEFKVNKLEITPTEVTPLETITVTAEVLNTGEITDNYSAALSIDGKVRGNKTIAIKPSENKTVIFSITEAVIGLHVVEIGSMQGRFTIRDNTKVSDENVIPSGRSRYPNQYVDWKISDYSTYGSTQNCSLSYTITNKHDKWTMKNVAVRGVVIAEAIQPNGQISSVRSIPCSGPIYFTELTWQFSDR